MTAWIFTLWRLVSGSRTGMIGAAAVAVVLVLGAVWLHGRSTEHDANERERLEQELEAHERIDDADIGIGLDDDARRERLRELRGSLAAGDRLKPDAAAHAEALAGDDMAKARETGLTLIARLSALFEWE